MPNAIHLTNKYADTRLSEKEIRLLTHLPSKLIRCSLHNISCVEVSYIESYEALLYAWGSTTTSHKTLLKWRLLQCRGNLFHALN